MSSRKTSKQKKVSNGSSSSSSGSSELELGRHDVNIDIVVPPYVNKLPLTPGRVQNNPVITGPSSSSSSSSVGNNDNSGSRGGSSSSHDVRFHLTDGSSTEDDERKTAPKNSNNLNMDIGKPKRKTGKVSDFNSSPQPISMEYEDTIDKIKKQNGGNEDGDDKKNENGSHNKKNDKIMDRSHIRSCHDAIMAVNSFGRYQFYTCLVLQYAAIVGAGIFALNTFNQHWDERDCFDEAYSYDDNNQSHLEMVCAQSYCANWTEPKNSFKSIAEEWSLVCDQNTYMQVIVGLLALGRSLGFILGGHIADYFGRKRALYVSQFGVCVISVLSIASQNWIVYGVCLYLTGVMWGMAFISAFVLSMECTDWSHRWIINAANQKSFQYCIVALIAYLTRDWRQYMIIVNVLFAPLLIFFLLFHESPRFLIYHQRLMNAARVLSDMASDRWNNVGQEISAKDLENIPQNRFADPKYPTPLELFRGWWRTKTTLTLMLGVITASSVSNFYIQNAHPEAGNIFMNIALYGAIRVWVPITIIFLDYRFKSIARRPIYMVVTFSVLACTCAVAVLEITGNDKGVQRQILAVVGASLSEAFFMCINQSIVEIYPTAIRGIALGWIMSAYGLGGTCATVFRYMETHGYHVWHPLPYVALTGFSALALISAAFGIPETKHKPMEDALNYSFTIVTNQNSHKVLNNGKRDRSFTNVTGNPRNQQESVTGRTMATWDTKFHF